MAALKCRRIKLVERRRPWVNNSLETSCRRGWRCSQMTRNHPTSTGYNYYHAGEIGLMELKLAGVKGNGQDDNVVESKNM